MRLVTAVSTALILLGIFAPPALSATTVSVYLDERFGGDEIDIVGDAGRNRLTVSHGTEPGSPYPESVFVIRDSQRIESDSPECASDAPTVLRCHVSGDANVDVQAKGGNDRIALRRSASASWGFLYGGAGRDVLKGGPNIDEIDGGKGRDILLGRRGIDYVDAKANDRDKKVACGTGGKDVAYIDKFRDPGPMGCEKVERR